MRGSFQKKLDTIPKQAEVATHACKCAPITFFAANQQLVLIRFFSSFTQIATQTLGDGRMEAMHKAAVEKIIATHVFLSSHFFHSIVQHASVNIFLHMCAF